jgi:BMFP domain-containing protein YqiC
MQTENRLLDDLAKLASGALGSLSGFKAELDTIVRQRLERLLGEMSLVSRDEFDAVKEMAANARARQEALETRLAELEAALKSRDTRPAPGEPGREPPTPQV